MNATTTQPIFIDRDEVISQFPLWDFFECNKFITTISRMPRVMNSQFPLWDFFECNTWIIIMRILKPIKNISQFPLWDFFECNRCRFGCLSGNWRGKSAGHTAYPAPATALIKIRTLFKFIAGGCGPTQSTSHGSCLNQASNPFLKGFFAQAIGQGRAYLRRRTAGSP